MICELQEKYEELQEKYAYKCKQYDDLRRKIKEFIKKYEKSTQENPPCPVCGLRTRVHPAMLHDTDVYYCDICDIVFAEDK